MQNESTHLRSLDDVRSALLDLLPPLDAAAPPCCAAPNPSVPPALRRPARAPPTLTPSRVRSACRANAAPLAPLHAAPSAQPRGAPACTAPPRRWGRGGHGGGRRNCGGPRRTGDGEGAVAEEQGRGRLGPSWWSGYGGGLSLRNRRGVENRLSLWPLNG